jgi:hypothetical protein
MKGSRDPCNLIDWPDRRAAFERRAAKANVNRLCCMMVVSEFLIPIDSNSVLARRFVARMSTNRYQVFAARQSSQQTPGLVPIPIDSGSLEQRCVHNIVNRGRKWACGQRGIATFRMIYMIYHGLNKPDQDTLEETRKFVDLLRQPGIFTKVIVHQNLDPNEIASHYRKPWGQDGSAFDFLEHTIVIDGVVSTANIKLSI